MPEGDTIFRAAAKMRKAIAGCVIRRAESQIADFPAHSLTECAIVSIEARGKHLLVHLDDTRVIHSHMGMHGAWHVYGADQPWHKPARQAMLAMQFDRSTAICFSPKLLELLTTGQLRHHRWLSRLGPDLLASDFDGGEALPRFHRHAKLPIGEAVMNQQIVSGIGNVFKSELLFLDRIHPLTPVGEITDALLVSMIRRARRLLQRNVLGGPRRTRFRGQGQNLWVYGRAGEACLKCGETICMTRQGDLGRTTYYCPNCQPRLDGSERHLRDPSQAKRAASERLK